MHDIFLWPIPLSFLTKTKCVRVSPKIFRLKPPKFALPRVLKFCHFFHVWCQQTSIGNPESMFCLPVQQCSFCCWSNYITSLIYIARPCFFSLIFYWQSKCEHITNVDIQGTDALCRCKDFTRIYYSPNIIIFEKRRNAMHYFWNTTQ